MTCLKQLKKIERAHTVTLTEIAVLLSIVQADI